MNTFKFIPEGWNNEITKLDTVEELKGCLENQTTLQGLVKSCDENYNLHINLGKGITGIIPRQEVEAINLEETGLPKINLCTGKVHKFVQFRIKDVQDERNVILSRKQVQQDENGVNKIVDYTPGIVTLPVTPGSVVKGASMLVGYKYGAIDIGTYQLDECIKIKDTPEKCSWRTMGLIDDIYALQYSSNVYQYKIAIKIGGGNYVYNEPLSLDESAFDKYRDMYAQFGLGVKTGIDLPVESLGYSGTSKLPGHLLDFAIGQYDTYTPIQLSQYINTIANSGKRLKPYLLKEVYAPSEDESTFGELVYETKTEQLGTVDVEKKYMDRVREGFHAVVTSGLGYGYMGNYYDSSGKTGTSQSFIDTDGDGVVDTETITSSFVGYSPSENPEMSVVVVSPDISHSYGYSTYQSAVTSRISANIVNKYFELNSN